MKSTFRILKFCYPYTSLIFLNTLFNLLSVLFSLFSISLIIPILGLLFGTIETPIEPVEELSIDNLKEYFYTYISKLLHNQGIISALGFICVLVAIGTILKNSSRYLALYCLTPLRNNVIKDIRRSMYSKMLSIPLDFINKFKKGDIVARMTNDLNEIEWSIMGVLEFFIKDPLHIIIFLISLIYISPTLTLIGLIFLPITALIIINISKSLKRSSLLSQNKIGDLISIIEESITNLKIIKAFHGKQFISQNFHESNEKLKKLNNRVLWRKDLASPMSEMLSTLVMVAIIWFGGRIVLTSNLAPDSFIGFLVIFSQILPPAKSLTSAFYSIQKGSASAERVLMILGAKSEKKDSQPKINQFENTILFKDVSFKYKKEINLKNINLKINKGQKIGIVGESGSGKSTLIELLLQFYSPSSGEIIIDNESVDNADFQALFTLVTQDVMLFNDTILNNLKLGNNTATKKEIEDATKAAHVHQIIKNCEDGYNTIIGTNGNNLSGGERQRIGIARALLSNAPILVFDEPTSSLDSETDNYVKKTLENLNSTKTIITITHKLNSIEEYDNIFVMKNGEIIEQGTHEFLLNKCGEYRKLYEGQTLKSYEEN